jgi:hypothetical protein
VNNFIAKMGTHFAIGPDRHHCQIGPRPMEIVQEAEDRSSILSILPLVVVLFKCLT